MCGIAGCLDLKLNSSDEVLRQTAERMTYQLRHRGPDADGIWIDAVAGVALGHRRLAIVDLSAEGLQPMHSADGRYVITYNGEIYNYQELRLELERLGHTYRGHSDT